jgi:hypothetical protein
VITKEDWVLWKDMSVTKDMFGEMTARAENIKEGLSKNAGVNPTQDRFWCGYLAGFLDIVNMQPEFEEDVKHVEGEVIDA